MLEVLIAACIVFAAVATRRYRWLRSPRIDSSPIRRAGHVRGEHIESMRPGLSPTRAFLAMLGMRSPLLRGIVTGAMIVQDGMVTDGRWARGMTFGDYAVTIQAVGSLWEARDQTGQYIASSTDWYVAAQAAHDALPSTGGHVFTKSSSTLAANVRRLTITKSHVEFSSDGQLLTGVDANDSSTAFTNGADTLLASPHVFVNRASYVLVKGFTVNGVGAYVGYARDGFLAFDSHHVHVQDFTVSGVAGAAFRCRGSGAYNVADPTQSVFNSDHIKFTNCDALNTVSFPVSSPQVKGFGFEAEYSTNVIVDDCNTVMTAESSYRTHFASNVLFTVSSSNGIVNGANSGEPWDLYRSDHVTVRSCEAADAVRAPGVSIYEYTDFITVEDCDFSRCATPTGTLTQSILITNTAAIGAQTNIKILRNKVAGGIFAQSTSAQQDIHIEGNSVGGRISISPQSGGTSKNITIRRNMQRAAASTDRAVSMANNTNVRITENDFYNTIFFTLCQDVSIDRNSLSGDGVTLVASVTVMGGNGYVRISENTIKNSQLQAIFAATTANGATAYLDIFHNEIEGAYQSGTGQAIGIQGSSSNTPGGTLSATYSRIVWNVFRATHGANCITMSDNPGIVMQNDCDMPNTGTVATFSSVQGGPNGTASADAFIERHASSDWSFWGLLGGEIRIGMPVSGAPRINQRLVKGATNSITFWSKDTLAFGNGTDPTDWQMQRVSTALMARTGSVAGPVAAKAVDYALSTGDEYVDFDATLAARNAYLPVGSASLVGIEFVVNKTDATGNAVNVHPNGADTINGANALVAIGTQWGAKRFKLVAANTWRAY